MKCECCGDKFPDEETLMEHLNYFEGMMELSYDEKVAEMKKDGYTIKEIKNLISPDEEEAK